MIYRARAIPDYFTLACSTAIRTACSFSSFICVSTCLEAASMAVWRSFSDNTSSSRLVFSIAMSGEVNRD